MKSSTTLPRPIAFCLFLMGLLCFSYSFGDHHGAKKTPVPLTDPIPEKIQKGDIIVGVEKQFRVPRTVDTSQSGRATTAYARLQYMIPVGDGSGRLSVGDLRGPLYMAKTGGNEVELYLDLREHDISFDASKMPNEMGLGGWAFHPEFSQKGKPGYGKFYTAISATSGSGDADYLKDDAENHESVLIEWTADDPAAIPFKGSHRELFRIGQFAANHNIGTVGFNPNAEPGDPDYGNLYFCLGDGGAAFDPKDYGQSLAAPHGAILRINPMAKGNAAYQIPGDNPFVSNPNAAPEIWAYGLRHPQHFSWDQQGRMFIGDIGQDQMEEVNLGQAGANYGWRLREGTFSSGSGVEGIYVGPLYDIPKDPLKNFVDPVAQYDHDEGMAVGSGFPYEGSAISELKGKYVFADLVRGRIFYIDREGLEPGNPAEISELRLKIDGKEQPLLDVVGYPNTYRNGPRADLRLGIDEDKELYLLTKGDGWVRKLVPAQ